MYLTETAQRYLRATGPEHDEIQADMAGVADEEGFPIIGPDAGGLLRTLAAMTRATSVFEFGSGFGYSAYWFLQGMPADGEIVLTEFDTDELTMAEEFFKRAGLTERAHFEDGDAMETINEYDGPFDVVLIDHQKERYADAFNAVREDLRVGSVVVADNLMRGPIDIEDLLAYFESGEALPDNKSMHGVADYVETVRATSGFQTTVVPVGSGLSLTVRVE
ncbi:O-methyltransferase [Halovenus rubra]|uniref:O-methyltransferase n=2 Tax=Halovenus rubra TaxID=869890 RepID=A0ACC7E028_9EURY|nr:O-methyltransferase [Halovenus rubra]